MGIIYKATNTFNDRSYCGKTTELLEKRIRKHKNEKRDSSVFHKALRKYGVDGFEWKVIWKGNNDFVSIMETFMIMVHHSHVSEGGYNLTWGGEGGNVWMNSPNKDEIRKKISKANRGKIRTPQQIERARLASLGKPKPGTSKYIREKNICWWVLTDLDDNTRVLRDMKSFCKANDLDQGAMSRVAQGKRNHHKGWKCKKVEKNE